MAGAMYFSDYASRQNGPMGIYEIGAGDGHPGVAEEMSRAFGHALSPVPKPENLGELIHAVGPARELQNNIATVQAALHTPDDAVEIAAGWAKRSGLLAAVERPYVYTQFADMREIDLAVITGGVRNWMARRAERLIELAGKYPIKDVLLVAGNRVMNVSEGPDVVGGMTEADYLRIVVANQLASLGLAATVVEVGSDKGGAVMRAAAERADGLIDLQRVGRIAIVSNAGAWPQNAGQFRRALQAVTGGEFDQDGQQLMVASDTFPLGTGTEPPATHQNPLSAVGQIARNLQELARHS